MAKPMFYTLQEAAEQLGIDEQAVKDMAAEGKLQQFRDRDQLMFKRDEVEALAGGGQQAGTDDSGDSSIGADDSGSIPLADDSTSGDSTAGAEAAATEIGMELTPGDTSSGDSTAGAEAAATEIGMELTPGDTSSGDSTAGGEGATEIGMELSSDDTSLTGVEKTSDDSGTGTFDLATEDSDAGTGTIDLADDSLSGSSLGLSGGEKDPNQGTGVSVFDADEVEDADPMAQTQINRPMAGDEEMALENIGSGSGLLDLTRETDDTSLGAAELLDEIYPGDATPAGTSLGPADSAAGPEPSDDSAAGSPLESAMGSSMDSVVGSSGVLEATQAATAEGADFETMGATQVDLDQPEDLSSDAALGIGYTYAEPNDPIGSGFGAGMLIGVTITLVIGLLVSFGALLDVRVAVIDQMTASANSLMIWCAGLLVLSIVGGVVGGLIGKAMASASAAAQPVAGAAE